jgi:hypothetical protein
LGPLFPEGYIIKETIVCDLFGGGAKHFKNKELVYFFVSFLKKLLNAVSKLLGTFSLKDTAKICVILVFLLFLVY